MPASAGVLPAPSTNARFRFTPSSALSRVPAKNADGFNTGTRMIRPRTPSFARRGRHPRTTGEPVGWVRHPAYTVPPNSRGRVVVMFPA